MPFMAALLTSCWDVLVHWVANSYLRYMTGHILFAQHRHHSLESPPSPCWPAKASSSLKPSLSTPTGPEPSVMCLLQGHRASGAHSVTLSLANTPALPPPPFDPVWVHPLRLASLKNRGTDSSWLSFSHCCNTSGHFISFPSLLAQW